MEGDERLRDLELAVNELQATVRHHEEKFDILDERLKGMNEKKIDPMKIKVDEIHQTIVHYRGFKGGVVFTVSIIWAVIGGIAVAVWQTLLGRSP